VEGKGRDEDALAFLRDEFQFRNVQLVELPIGDFAVTMVRQFLFESLSICLLGGVMGCLLGVGFTYLVQSLTQWQTQLAWWSMVVAIGVSLADGVAFGTYPAWKAGKLDPIEALRYE